MTEKSQQQKVYAVNLFDISDEDMYRSYFNRLPVEIPAHHGRPVALGRFRENVSGDITPRTMFILVEWESEAAFNSFREDPALADMHPLRVNSTSSYSWQLYDALDLTAPDLTVEEVLPWLRS
jgi:uncharacterized protein (DUF1330 family)